MEPEVKTPEKTRKSAQERAQELMTLLSSQKAEKATIDEKMKSAKKELLELATKNRKKFVDGRWKLEGGYVRLCKTTEVVEKEGVFSAKMVLAKLPDAVKDLKYDVNYLKKIFDDDERKKIALACGLELSEIEELEVEIK